MAKPLARPLAEETLRDETREDRGPVFARQYDEQGAAAIGWYGWYAIRAEGAEGPAELVGSIGYMGPPGEDGIVEIGYSMVPEARGRGYATELALALAERALAMPQVRRVIAHSARDNVASHTVLRRAGFREVAHATEPESLRFERSR